MNFYLVCWLGIILGGTLNMDFYGDNQRWWIGTVEEGSGAGTDPICLGRARVRIDGIHGPDISLNDLPYAQCLLPVTGGGTSGVGENPQLLPGCRVTGFFLDGTNSQLPTIYGCLPHVGIPSITQSEIINEARTVIVRNKGTDQTLESSNDTLGRGYTFPDTVQNPDGSASTGTDGSGQTQRGQQNNPNRGGGGTSVAPTEFVSTATYSTRATIDFDNISKIWYWFEAARNGLYRPHHIAGIIGNLIHESGSNKNLTISTTVISAVEGETSQGIAQWNPDSGGTGGRLGDLRDYARDQGLDMFDLYTQVAFIDHELHTHDYLNDEFFDTQDTEQATAHFTRNYLRPTWCRTGKTSQRSETRINDTSVEKPDGTFVTNTCEPFTNPDGTTQTLRYPEGNFPSGKGFIRAGEESRLKVAIRIYNKFTQGTNP